ncbi:MAG: hypothetical protein ACJ77K_06595 [Bacteroidia bacterium]
MLLKPELKVAYAQYLAQEVTDKITTENIPLDHAIYQGVSSAPIMYAGEGDGVLGLTLEDHSIFVYEGALTSANNAASTVLHEFNGHYMEQELDLIPDTESQVIKREEPNPWIEMEDQYYGCPTRPMYDMLPSSSSSQEEINAYGLQKELNDKNILPIPEKMKSVEGNLKDYEEALKNALEAEKVNNSQNAPTPVSDPPTKPK